jgi:hypothetical protein
MKTRTFSIFIDGKNRELMVRSPSLHDQKEATKIYNQTFSEALKAKAVVRAKLDDLLVEQGLWDGVKQAKFTELQSNILDGERKLAKGGISLKDAKQIALDMRKNREELRELISVKTNLDTHTAEGQADNARFNYLVSACTVYSDTNAPYFNNFEEYNNKSADPVAVLAAQNLANMLYGLDNDYEEKLPENKFLKQYKFVDSKLRLINKDGRLVDEQGRLIDENGRYVNEIGQFVDKEGNLVNEQGDYVIEFSPFLDEEGAPVLTETSEQTESKLANEKDQQVETSTENTTNTTA